MIEVRRAQLKDLNSIAGIEERVFRTPWKKGQIKWELEQKNLTVNFVITENAEVVGYLFALNTGSEAQILNIAVDLPFQHRGYGKKLMQDFFNSLSSDTTISLEVRRSNLPAIKLYSEFGFEPVSEKAYYYPDGEDALVMVKDF